MANAKVKKASVEVLESAVKWTYTDGSVIEAALADFPTDMVNQLALHGLKQKGSDCYAGADISAEEAFAATTDVIETLRQGLWSAKREAAGEKQSSMVVKAYIRLARTLPAFADMPDADIIARWKGYDDDRRKVIRSQPQFQLHLEAVKAEREAEMIAKREAKVANLRKQAAEGEAIV